MSNFENPIKSPCTIFMRCMACIFYGEKYLLKSFRKGVLTIIAGMLEVSEKLK
ncbi:MAG: hypothetical protein FWC30_01590 [Candidatus Bathyarchaeota archaeon]|nr:hypothetical protein [Candidatus Termiticorpusculum sp.]